MTISTSRRKTALAIAAALGLAAGVAFHAAQWVVASSWAWGLAAAVVLVMLIVESVKSLARGDVGLDIVAGLSIVTAIAFGETFAANVVGLMYAGGQLLEVYAANRAGAEMQRLLSGQPRTALRYVNGAIQSCDASGLRPGDRVLVRQGDVVPADGTVVSGLVLIDKSALTGESLPVRLRPGDAVPSGAVNRDMAFDIHVTRLAEDSAYATILRLVKAAQDSKAPMVRLADRFAIWFLLLTIAVASAAYLFTGDRMRLLAVLVVATPCPLILAVPVALISGVSKAARRGVLLKGGAVLEVMARAKVLVIDKTGTLTHGKAEVVAIETQDPWTDTDLLRQAASLDQASGHAIAQSIVTAALRRGLALDEPAETREQAGEGIQGTVAGRSVVVGGQSYVSRTLGLQDMPNARAPAGSVVAAVAVDGKLAGHVILSDTLRPDVAQTLKRFRSAGFARLVLASGDSAPVVERVGGGLGFDAMHAELTPERKVDVVTSERAHGPVLMAGDGVNDAPALAAADAGIAMGAHGSPASAEAADAVLLTDTLERIAEAVEIAQRSRAIAMQSVSVGLGLSVAAMVAAAFGYLPVVQGALLQEAIDLAVILNALRALR